MRLAVIGGGAIKDSTRGWPLERIDRQFKVMITSVVG
jgi:hypothetical protein